MAYGIIRGLPRNWMPQWDANAKFKSGWRKTKKSDQKSPNNTERNQKGWNFKAFWAPSKSEPLLSLPHCLQNEPNCFKHMRLRYCNMQHRDDVDMIDVISEQYDKYRTRLIGEFYLVSWRTNRCSTKSALAVEASKRARSPGDSKGRGTRMPWPTWPM